MKDKDAWDERIRTFRTYEEEQVERFVSTI